MIALLGLALKGDSDRLAVVFNENFADASDGDLLQLAGYPFGGWPIYGIVLLSFVPYQEEVRNVISAIRSLDTAEKDETRARTSMRNLANGFHTNAAATEDLRVRTDYVKVSASSVWLDKKDAALLTQHGPGWLKVKVDWHQTEGRSVGCSEQKGLRGKGSDLGAIGKLVTIDGGDKLPGLRLRGPLQHRRLRLQRDR